MYKKPLHLSYYCRGYGIAISFDESSNKTRFVYVICKIRKAIEQMHSGDLPRKKSDALQSDSSSPPESRPLNN